MKICKNEQPMWMIKKKQIKRWWKYRNDGAIGSRSNIWSVRPLESSPFIKYFTVDCLNNSSFVSFPSLAIHSTRDYCWVALPFFLLYTPPHFCISAHFMCLKNIYFPLGPVVVELCIQRGAMNKSGSYCMRGLFTIYFYLFFGEHELVTL